MKYLWVPLTLVALVFYSVGEYYSKTYADTGRKSLAAIATLAYLVCTILWFPTLKNNNHLAIMSVIWSVAYALVGITIGLSVFQEKLTLIQWVGTALGVVAILLLSIEWH